MRLRFAVVRVCLCLCAVVAGGCGLGDRQDRAERIRGARATAVQEETASGVLTLELSRDPDMAAAVPAGSDAAEMLAAVPMSATLAVHVDIDFAAQRARVVPANVPDAGGSVFDRTTLFVRRSNLRPSEKRVWAKLDFEGLPEDEPRFHPPEDDLNSELIAAATAINPAHVVDLAVGALAGSVTQLGREDLDGVMTTKYEANVSIDRALTELDLDDAHRATRELMLRLLLGLNEDVRPGQFWIDDDGRLRKARLELRQRVSRNESNDLVLTLTLPAYGAAVDIPSPTSEEIVEVGEFGRIVRAALPKP